MLKKIDKIHAKQIELNDEINNKISWGAAASLGLMMMSGITSFTNNIGQDGSKWAETAGPKIEDSYVKYRERRSKTTVNKSEKIANRMKDEYIIEGEIHEMDGLHEIKLTDAFFDIHSAKFAKSIYISITNDVTKMAETGLKMEFISRNNKPAIKIKSPAMDKSQDQEI